MAVYLYCLAAERPAHRLYSEKAKNKHCVTLTVFCYVLVGSLWEFDDISSMCVRETCQHHRVLLDSQLTHCQNPPFVEPPPK